MKTTEGPMKTPEKRTKTTEGPIKTTKGPMTTSSLTSGSQCIWTTRTTASTFDLRKVCTIDATWVPFLHRCAALSPFLFFSQRHADPQRGCCTWKACPEGDSWYMGLLAGTVIKPFLVLTEVYFLTLVPMDTVAQALIQILKSILDHRT